MTFDSRLLNGIEVLAAVVEAGSFVPAAESLGLTQSGVSRAIARLETRVAMERLLAVAPEYTLRDVDFGNSFFVRGPERGSIDTGGEKD